MITIVPLNELVNHYCETQEAVPAEITERLWLQNRRYANVGWFLSECGVLDSSCLGERTIVPFGPNNTFKEPPTTPFSPRGLASDMAVAKMVAFAETHK